jgi:hypothetical protein
MELVVSSREEGQFVWVMMFLTHTQFLARRTPERLSLHTSRCVRYSTQVGKQRHISFKNAFPDGGASKPHRSKYT